LQGWKHLKCGYIAKEGDGEMDRQEDQCRSTSSSKWSFNGKATIKRRRETWIGHILRHDNLLKLFLKEGWKESAPQGRELWC